MNKKIGVFSFADKIPNIALEKISKYYSKKGYFVFENNYNLLDEYEKIFISIIFDWDLIKLSRFKKHFKKTIIGGSAYNENTKLPEEIESIKPKINIGYSTRGCIRTCPWCSVWRREGNTKIVNDLYDLWDGKTKDITLLDNNILAEKEHFKTICNQAIKENIRLNFYQGLDHRLLNDENCKLLRKISHRRLRFSFDQSKYKEGVVKAIDMLNKHNLKNSTWFVLVGFNETFEKDLERVNLLKEKKQDVYIARYNFTRDTKYIPFCKWINHRKNFNSMTWEQYITQYNLKKQNKKGGGNKKQHNTKVLNFTTQSRHL